MRIYICALSVFLALAVTVPARAAEMPRPAQANQKQPKKIWTNDDTDQLHSRGLISIVGQELNVSATPTTTAPSESVFPVYSSKLEDPTWYAEKAADLQAEMEKREAALREEQAALARTASGVAQAGIAMDKHGEGVTPEAVLAILAAQVQEVQNQIDELSDLARQNSISPGVLRG